MELSCVWEPTNIQTLLDMIQSKRLILVFLMETRLHNNKLQPIQNKVRFSCMFSVDSVGYSGGLMLFWKEEIVVKILSY